MPSSAPPASIAPPRPVGFSSPVPSARSEVAGTVWDGRIVIAGGLDAQGRASDRLDIYDPASDSWSPGPSLPFPLHHTAAVVGPQNRLWIVGGYTADGEEWQPTKLVWSIAPGQRQWRKEPSLSLGRGALAAAVVNGIIVTAGGTTDGGGRADQTSRLVEFLEPGAKEWTRAPDLFEQREHLAMAAVAGRVLAIGGRVGTLDSTLRSVESWGPGEGTWRREPPLKKARAGFGAGTVAGAVCIAGGEQSDRTISLVECLRDSEWSVVGQLREARHGLVVVGLAGRLHAVAGGPKPGLTVSSRHEVLDPGS